MKYYLNGKLLFVDMNTPYRFAVMEGNRAITFQQTKEAAEAVAYDRRRWREKIIAEFGKALHLQDVIKLGEKPNRLYCAIRENYGSDAEIYAAIQRQQKTLESIRVVPLETEP